MSSHPIARCIVCREPQSTPDGWFHLTENRWTDRLRILRFQQALTTHPGIYSVCCADHVRELVVQWMTTGRLDFPFARLPFSPRRILSQRSDKQGPRGQPPAPPSSVLGEIAVHRESLTRTLRENPQALSAVLDALIHAIEPEIPKGTATTEVHLAPLQI